MQTIEHFTKIILKLFPEVKKATPKPNIDYFSMNLSWLLNNDPQRPRKRSKTIRILISHERISDYENLPQNEKITNDHKLKDYIINKKSQLDPNHNTPYGEEEPIEEWHVVW
ncbi:hypothetical protein ACFL6P_08560 [Candidatus Latescibacterota bacterium]